jgi:hypothetical protein
MATRKIYLDAFFDQYEDFLQQMQAVFPGDPDWPLYIAGLSIFRRTNPAMIVQKTWKHISKFEDTLKARDEQFFMTRDFSDITEGEEPLEQTITKLKGMWAQLSPHNRNVVWDYINNITYLARKCSGQ